LPVRRTATCSDRQASAMRPSKPRTSAAYPHCLLRPAARGSRKFRFETKSIDVLMQSYPLLAVSLGRLIERRASSRPGIRGQTLATLAALTLASGHSCPRQQACQCFGPILPQRDTFFIIVFPMSMVNVRARQHRLAGSIAQPAEPFGQRPPRAFAVTVLVRRRDAPARVRPAGRSIGPRHRVIRPC
jgi:hypothetical protein